MHGRLFEFSKYPAQADERLEEDFLHSL